ncbi:polyphosphate polymerase domain-containing protein [Streptococcus sp. sy018]|uniref:polyphosphate polymerase domain-containing protein n=1 Tax=Streptococcus sp. sy018 TaxID=2600147 RepID=UPI0011B5C568|nr:polyphosphate polymerase domain-containing protein [Streptococcus sp. sy018]TWS94815.1 polyphosphate polymerase domain-containing protein [Streptococcus sp. sy018]
MAKDFFKRKEKKYLLNQAEYEQLTLFLQERMLPDPYFKTQNNTVYFDNIHDEMIINSIHGTDYKCKVRARHYAGTDQVFLEIKSKIYGTVFKRRIIISQDDYQTFLDKKQLPDSQIARELLYLFQEKQLAPKIFIIYNRTSYMAKEASSDLRITFDERLRSSTTNLDLFSDTSMTPHFDEPRIIMEIKTKEGMPDWLVDYLSQHCIYPQSFSKYGKIFTKARKEELIHV